MTQVRKSTGTLATKRSARSRPALVVDPRINQADIDYSLIPSDVDVFRCGPFSAEELSLFGREVAGWFIADDVTVSEIAKVKLRGEYAVDTIFFDSSRCERSVRDFSLSGVENVVDYAPLLVSLPEIAAHFIGDLRPSALSTMTTTVAAMGYTTILVLGAALGSISTSRPFIAKRPSRRHSSTLSLSRRFDPWDHTNAEVALLQTVKDSFEDTAVLDVTVGNQMFPVLAASRPQPTDQRMAPEPKYPNGSTHLYKPLPVGAHGEALRCAYVTMCDSHDYLWGVRALANSLGRVSDVPLILMVPPGFDCGEVTFEADNVRLYEVNSIRNPHQPRSHQSRFSNTFTKLEVFGLTFLDRAVFIDADTVVLRELDELFTYEGFAAAPDFGLRLESSRFNSGVFVCSPGSELYTKVLDAIPDTPSYDGGDQGFLNEFIDDVVWLPPEFNSLRRALGRYPDVIRREDAKVIHFVGPKPWSLNREPEWSELDGLWFSQLTEREKIDFIIELRERVSAETATPRPRPRPEPAAPRLKGFRLAEQLLAAGKPNQAIRVSKEALRNNSDSLANRRVLARALAASGNRSDAARVAVKTLGLKAARKVRKAVAK